MDNSRSTSEQYPRRPQKADTDTPEVVLFFHFDSFGRCTLTTKWRFPLPRATATIGVFNAKGFDVPGGQTVLVDLLFALKNEFRDWCEQRIATGGRVGRQVLQLTEDSIAFSVTKLASGKQLHLAHGLFLEAAKALAKLWEGNNPSGNSHSPGSSDPPPMPYAAHGGLRESRDYHELVQEISSGLTDCELSTVERIVNGKSVSQISKEDGVSRAAVRGRVLSAIGRNDYWKISSRFGLLKKRINQHT